MNRFVVGFFFDPEDVGCLLIERSKPDWQMDKVNGIGGKIRELESPRECMIREFEEETGIKTSDDQWQILVELQFVDRAGCLSVMHVMKGNGNIPTNFRYAMSEGVVSKYCVPPDNMEQTARWLYWICKDSSFNKLTKIRKL